MSFPWPSTTPCWVLNIRLKALGRVQSRLPHWGQVIFFALIKSIISWGGVFSPAQLAGCSSDPLSCCQFSTSLSARSRDLHFLQSIRGSEKLPTWPEASQAVGFMRMAASRPTISMRSVTNFFHQAPFKFLSSSTPRGPKSHALASPP